MGKSAKFMKRPTKKAKETIKETKKRFQAAIPTPKKNEIKKVHASQEPSEKSVSEAKKAVDSVKVTAKKTKGKPSRILEGRPDYVDLMYGRPKSRK
ncbi:hypothetical protein DSO57_1039055 [Entomophthora muscae]|uniref:Uncharacterized protein n=1 Tax=Entomophthora muscae TaxID=34485 RepID=A0ACC2TWR9_9FUNG|nr:hypothetical protein DSO57_1039055 [Entomophthora muscae]